MKPLSDGFASAAQKADVEAIIEAISLARMRFFVRSPLIGSTDVEVQRYFPAATMLTPVPDDLAGDAWPWDHWDDPFLDASASVDAARASYLAPGIHLNYYLDWLLFDVECEEGSHSVFEYEDRPSNIARRSHFEAFAHSILIALKSALDRLVAVVGRYVSGVSPHMTWGRIKDGRPSGFMSVVEEGRDTDELLEFLHNEYVSWIAEMVAPRDDIIHYADLQTTWHFGGLSETEQKPFGLHVGHVSTRDDKSPTIDLAILHRCVTLFYALTDHVFLTLATRLPLDVRKKVRGTKPNLGELISQTFGIPPSKRIGEVKAAIGEAIKAGEIARGLEPESYIHFLRSNRSRFGL
jgi:hypothetical protein